MKKVLFYAALLTAAYLLQTSPGIAALLVAVPDLLLIVTACAGYFHGRIPGMACGFAAGIMIDLFYGQIGAHALILVLVGWIAGDLYKKYFENSIRMPVILVLCTDLLYGVYLYVTRFFFRGRVRFPAYLLRVILPEAACTALFAAVIYYLVYLAEKKWIGDAIRSRTRSWLKD